MGPQKPPAMQAGTGATEGGDDYGGNLRPGEGSRCVADRRARHHTCLNPRAVVAVVLLAHCVEAPGVAARRAARRRLSLTRTLPVTRRP